MFYDVKIMNSQGKVEKIVPAHELSKSYWKKFQAEETNKSLNATARKQVPGWVKRKFDVEYSFSKGRSTSAA